MAHLISKGRPPVNMGYCRETMDREIGKIAPGGGLDLSSDQVKHACANTLLLTLMDHVCASCQYASTSVGNRRYLLYLIMMLAASATVLIFPNSAGEVRGVGVATMAKSPAPQRSPKNT